MMQVCLLTGGDDRPYVFGLATALIKKGLSVDIIGSDGVDSPEWHITPGIRFLNLRGSQKVDASLARKISRILTYYARLICYAWGAPPMIYHILWNNKFEAFDRTVLMMYYKVLGKRVVMTAHNINKRKRDSNDTILNRLTLKIQYKLCDHIFVHTEQMKRELIDDFCINPSLTTVIPFGINNFMPHSGLTVAEAKSRLAISSKERTILFFGRIVPYKGLEFLVAAFKKLPLSTGEYRLIIAGRPDNDTKQYCEAIRETIVRDSIRDQVLLKLEFIPDDKTELYFKAADVLVLPYRNIYQSGVLFLAYSFGLPVIASDVGGLRHEIIEGRTGLVCKPEDPDKLAMAIERYFASDLYRDLDRHRQEIREYARQRYSWDVVGELTGNVYSKLLGERFPGEGIRTVSR